MTYASFNQSPSNLALTLSIDNNGIATGKFTNQSPNGVAGIPLKGSIRILWRARRVENSEIIQWLWVDDDANGNLINDMGEKKGTIDYVSGAVQIDTNRKLLVNTPIYVQDARAVLGMSTYHSV